MIRAPEHCLACGAEATRSFRAGGVDLRRCRICGLAWRAEFPETAALRTLYGDDYFERWGIDAPGRLAEVRAMKTATCRMILDEIAAHRGGGRLLDVGCALGFLLAVARERGYDAWGLDLNESAIAHARREFGERVHAGPLDEQAFPGQRFDVVTLVDVLEHVPDPAALLGAVFARLAPGGIAAAVLPDTDSLASRWLGRRWPHYTAEHLFYWSHANLPRFLEKQGFRVLALRRGLRKTFTARYLAHYARALGRRTPPGLGALGGLRLRVPTGEMLVIARPAERAA